MASGAPTSQIRESTACGTMQDCQLKIDGRQSWAFARPVRVFVLLAGLLGSASSGVSPAVDFFVLAFDASCGCTWTASRPSTPGYQGPATTASSGLLDDPTRHPLPDGWTLSCRGYKCHTYARSATSQTALALPHSRESVSSKDLSAFSIGPIDPAMAGRKRDMMWYTYCCIRGIDAA